MNHFATTALNKLFDNIKSYHRNQLLETSFEEFFPDFLLFLNPTDNLQNSHHHRDSNDVDYDYSRDAHSHIYHKDLKSGPTSIYDTCFYAPMIFAESNIVRGGVEPPMFLMSRILES